MTTLTTQELPDPVPAPSPDQPNPRPAWWHLDNHRPDIPNCFEKALLSYMPAEVQS